MEYYSIDREITRAMLSDESKLPKKRRSDWSAKLQGIVYRIRYFKLLLQKSRGSPITDKVLDNIGKVAGEKTRTQDEGEIRKKLKEAWKSLAQ